MERRALVAEGLGTALLVATVVGSGIMAARLADANDAVALLGNTIATAAALFVLITIFAPVSGASFNPAVTLIAGPRSAGAIAVQVAGAVAGTLTAHAMFGVPVAAGATPRATPGEWLGEFIATAGLLLTIRLGQAHAPDRVAALVAAWIAAGYWFTASTSFANPAVTIARAISDTFAGIRPVDVPAFVAAQLLGALAGHALGQWFTGKDDAR